MELTQLQEELNSVWNGWQVKERIGKGSFGSVYRIERQEFGQVYESALKVITIPQDQSEIDTLYNDGMDEESIKSYLSSVVEDIVKEFALMYQLRGNSNIVSYEDHCVIEHKDDIGWNIYIRMELLTPLFEYVRHRTLTIRDIIHMGIDMCNALEICQKYRIIHRDIKPENMFATSLNVFKLGDFGIARQVERTSTNLSKKGTYTYMAPELYKGEECNSTVDIYSLGIVLYRFLNNNRTPFLPPYPETLRITDKERANVLRMSGKEMPKPCNADGRLAEIVLKACAYKPSDRYESATLLKEALESILYNEHEVGIIYPGGDDVVNRSHEFSRTDFSKSSKDTDPVTKSDENSPVLAEAITPEESVTEESMYYLFGTEVEASKKKEELRKKVLEEAKLQEEREKQLKEEADRASREKAEEERLEAQKQAELDRKAEEAKAEAERKKAEEAKAEAERKKAEEAKAEAERKKAEEAKKREEAKAEEDRKRAEEAKKRAEAKAEAERKKAEEAKKRAEAKAEAERKKAEEAKKKAEAKAAADAKRKAEAERKKAEREAKKKEQASSGSSKSKKYLLIALLVLILGAGGGYGGWRYYQKTLEREVPALTNMTLDAATIKAAGDDDSLIVIESGEEYSDTVEKGNIISQDVKAGTVLKKGDEVKVVISKGALKEVPDVTGKKKSTAQESVEKNSLIFKVSKESYSDKVAKGKVISQDPEAGATIEENQTVSVVVSKGIEQVKVPDVTGKSLDAAKKALKKAKLKFGSSSSDYSDSVDEGDVISQSIDSGKKVDKNSKVNLTVSLGPEPEPTPSQSSGSSSKKSSSKKSSSKKSSSSGGGDSIGNWDLVN